MRIENAAPYRQQIIDLLAANNLPFGDLPDNLQNFLVALNNSSVVGSIGIEEYGGYGLLRSLAVDKAFRDKKIGNELLQEIEALAISKNLTGIYLLTETAPEYFKRYGYGVIDRNDIPVAIQASSEFSHVCPVSAIAMKKDLK